MKNRTVLLAFLFIVLMAFFAACGNNSSSSPTESYDISNNVTDVGVKQQSFTNEFVLNCNLNSGGYVALDNDFYYYSNFADENKIYRCDKNGENSVCIDDHNNASYPKMSVKNGYVYYLRSTLLEKPEQISDFEIINYNQLFRYKDGKIEELSAENVISYTVSDEFIFYTTADLKLYRINIDGTDKKQIFITSFPMNIQTDNSLLYLSANETVITIDFNGENESVYQLINHNFVVNSSEYYYIDLNDLSLNKITDLVTQDSKCIVDKEILSFTIHKDRIIYSDLNTGEIVSCNFDGSDSKVLMKNASNPISLGENLICVSKDKIVLIK